MPTISLSNLDTAGGVIEGGSFPTWTFNGIGFVGLGDKVKSHGNSPHSNAVMVEASSWFTIDGKPVVVSGNRASCDHRATGSSSWTIPL